jgi:Helicase associated domain
MSGLGPDGCRRPPGGPVTPVGYACLYGDMEDRCGTSQSNAAARFCQPGSVYAQDKYDSRLTSPCAHFAQDTHGNSLVSMAMYHFDSMGQGRFPVYPGHAAATGSSYPSMILRSQKKAPHPQAVFHPVDESKELTLRYVLGLPEDEFVEDSNVARTEPIPKYARLDHEPGGVRLRGEATDGFGDDCPDAHHCCSMASSPSLHWNETISEILQSAFELADSASSPAPLVDVLEVPLPHSMSSFSESDTHEALSTPLQAADESSTLVSNSVCKKRIHQREDDASHVEGDRDFSFDEENFDGGLDGGSISEKSSCNRANIWPSSTEEKKPKRRKTRGRRFRAFQAGQWAEKFAELCEYQRKFGHCLVSHTYVENLALSRWVRRQRYQYKLRQESNPKSTMTGERIEALENIGFVWDSQGSSWMERLQELKAFKAVFYHCNVPSGYLENKCLATWIKGQRKFET